MGLEQVKEEVIKTSQERADALIAEAKQEVKKLLLDKKSELSDRKSALEKDLMAEAESIFQREVAALELEHKKALLDAKKDLVESVYTEAFEKICEASQTQRKKQLDSLLKKAKKEIDVASIQCSKADSKQITDVETNEAPIKGGLIAQNADGTILVNLSYEALFDETKQKTVNEISQMLFK